MSLNLDEKQVRIILKTKLDNTMICFGLRFDDFVTLGEYKVAIPQPYVIWL